jgi:hypothetical protein
VRLIVILALFAVGCQHAQNNGITRVISSKFHSNDIERCLKYWVANYSEHSTNNFYVGPIAVNQGELTQALVYWKEERTLLTYSGLAEDAPKGAEGFAWGHDLKLDRDTVDTPTDIAGSSYLVTHRMWINWMEDCIAKGRHYEVTLKEANKTFGKHEEQIK